MKYLLACIAICFLLVAQSLPVPAAAQNATSNDNSNAVITTNTNTSHPNNAEKFKASPALVPLLIVPLAGILYLIYERASHRRK